jgi:MFS family permease
MMSDGRGRIMFAGRAFRHRNYRLFFAGMVVVTMGVWMQAVAQGWLLGTLVGWDRAAIYIGLLGIVGGLPMLFLTLFGGMIADIWPKRRTLMFTQIGLALPPLVLGFLTATGMVQVWHVFAVALVSGVITAVDMPTRQAFSIEMVGNEDLVNAVAINSAIFNGARVVGPAIGGVLIGITGTATCFIAGGIAYLALVVALLAMDERALRPAARLAVPGSVATVVSNVADGLRYVRRTPVVLLATLMMGFLGMFGMNMNVIVPVMAVQTLGAGSEGYGLLLAATGMGAFLSAIGVAAMARPRVRVLIAGGLVVGSGHLLLASTGSYGIAAVALFLVGVGWLASGATANTLVQTMVPGPLRGRVMSVYTTVFAGSMPIGSGLTGAVGGALGIVAAVVINGMAVLGATTVAGIAVLRGWVRLGEDGSSLSAAASTLPLAPDEAVIR